MTKKILFIPTNSWSAWGGSELLWAQMAILFHENHYDTGIYIKKWLTIPPELDAITKVIPAQSQPYVINDWHKGLLRLAGIEYEQRVKKGLAKINPDFAIISQGVNIDGLMWMEACRELGIPFVTISQSVQDFHWPEAALVLRLRQGFTDAKANYFVSNANKLQTEKQIGYSVPNAEVIFNPFNVDFHQVPEYPKGDIMQLGCVARFDFYCKGQDILLEALNQKKWRERPIMINFYGKGPNEFILGELIKRWNLSGITSIKGHVPPGDIWKTNHALVLPSRYEGLPLALVEALVSARTAIVTNVSGNGEVLLDNVTGFLAKACTCEMLDEALERAWQVRDQWQQTGARAREHILTIVPENPARYLFDKIRADFL
jgi:glycosyltransferase involved in cell wall biosynthesis